MKAQIYKWKKYGVLRSEHFGDTWYARYESSLSKYPYVEEMRSFKVRADRDQFIKDHNNMIKIYGQDEYYQLYRNLMK